MQQCERRHDGSICVSLLPRDINRTLQDTTALVRDGGTERLNLSFGISFTKRKADDAFPQFLAAATLTEKSTAAWLSFSESGKKTAPPLRAKACSKVVIGSLKNYTSCEELPTPQIITTVEMTCDAGPRAMGTQCTPCTCSNAG